MRMLVLVMALAGVVLVMVNELLASRRRVRVVYKYLPRDLDTYMREQPTATAQFGDLFAQENVPYRLRA